MADIFRGMMAQPVYLVLDVKIHDADAYGKYKEKVKPLIESYCGEYLSLSLIHI